MYLVYITKHHLPLTTQYSPVMFVGMEEFESLEHTYMYLVYITQHPLPLTTQYSPVMFVGMKNLKQSGTHIHVLSLHY